MQDTAANTRSNMILPDDKWIVQGFRNVIVDPNCSVRSGNHTYSPQEESLKNVKHIAFWKGIVFFITFDQPDTVKWQDAEIELDPVASSSKSRKLPYPGEITGICVSQRALYIFIRINDSTKLIRLNLSSLIGIEPNQDMTPYQVSGINTEDNDMWAFFAVTLQECDSLIIFDKSTGLLEYGIWRSDYRTIKMHKLPQIKNRFYQNSGALCTICVDKNDDNESIKIMGVEKSRGELFSLDVHRDSPQKAKIQVIEQKDNALWKRTVAVGFFDVSLSNLTSPAGDMPAKNSFIIVTVNNPAEVYAMSLSTNQTKPRKILSYGEKQDMVASMMEQSPFEVIPADIIFSNNNEYILFGNSRNENWRIYYTPVVKDSPDFNPKHYNPTLFVSP